MLHIEFYIVPKNAKFKVDGSPEGDCDPGIESGAGGMVC